MEKFYDPILLHHAMSFVGTPYRWGGDDPMAGYDCSGLVVEILQAHGMLDPNVDKTAENLYNYFKMDKSIETRLCSLGALVFYGHSHQRITHVAFGLDRYRILEAGAGGKRIITMGDAIKYNAYVRIRPVSYRSDMVTVLKLRYNSIGEI